MLPARSHIHNGTTASSTTARLAVLRPRPIPLIRLRLARSLTADPYPRRNLSVYRTRDTARYSDTSQSRAISCDLSDIKPLLTVISKIFFACGALIDTWPPTYEGPPHTRDCRSKAFSPKRHVAQKTGRKVGALDFHFDTPDFDRYMTVT